MVRIGVRGEWLRVGGRVSEQLGRLQVETDLIAWVPPSRVAAQLTLDVGGQKLTLIYENQNY